MSAHLYPADLAIPGVTGIRQIDIGNIIHPTDANGLVVVTQVEPISLIFTLPQTDLPQIQEQMAQRTDESHRLQPGQQDSSIKASSCWSTTRSTQTTGTIRLKANFPNPQHRLWPGRTGQCASAARHAE